MRRIFLDTAAGTPLDKRVRGEFLRGLVFGNPSSIHSEGKQAATALAMARERVAALINAHPNEIIFTSGGTESNNFALLGVASAIAESEGAPQIIISAIEHSSITVPATELKRRGWEVVVLSVTSAGMIESDALASALTTRTRLVSLGLVNNEIGVVQPIADLRRVVERFRKKHAQAYPYFHTDACQAPRFLPLELNRLGVDLLTFNGAKIYGPRDSAVLYVKRGVKIAPLLFGGGQEFGRRAGTENVAGAIALARALEICALERTRESVRLLSLRDYFIRRLLDLVPKIEVNGEGVERLPSFVSITIEGVNADWLVINLDHHGVACSTGSACSIKERDASYVIMALGKSQAQAESTIRFSFDRKTTRRDLDYTAKTLARLVAETRETQVLLANH